MGNISEGKATLAQLHQKLCTEFQKKWMANTCNLYPKSVAWQSPKAIGIRPQVNLGWSWKKARQLCMEDSESVDPVIGGCW